VSDDAGPGGGSAAVRGGLDDVTRDVLTVTVTSSGGEQQDLATVDRKRFDRDDRLGRAGGWEFGERSGHEIGVAAGGECGDGCHAIHRKHDGIESEEGTQ
jgi:hypothetical protein